MMTTAAESPTIAFPDLTSADAAAVLRWAADAFAPRIAFASSFGAEDMVVLDLIVKNQLPIPTFTIDTGRLPQETYDLIEATRGYYDIDLAVYCPETAELEDLVRQEGPNLFYRSVDLRKRCCAVRKITPLRRALSDVDAWVCGLRREQSPTRAEVDKAENDAFTARVKVNPLADWTESEVWDYISANGVPYNALHDRDYPSIGCAPCTRAIKPGEDVRAGRWWWESPEQKECGLHQGKGGAH